MYNLDPISVRDFLSKTPQDIKWVWEPFIPQGALCMCAAYMKTGKSTMVYGLVASVVRGQPFIAYPTTKTKTLLLAVEESPRDVALRLTKFGLSKDQDDPLFIHSAPVNPSKEWYDGLKKYIETNEIGLLVIDTLASYWNVLDENSNSEVHKAVTPLLWLARSTNCAILAIHHINKGEGSGGRLIRGASASFALVDQALILHRYGDPKSTKRRMETLGRYDDTPQEIILALDGDTYMLVGDPAEASLDALKGTLQEFFANHPGVSLNAFDLGKAIGAPSKKIMKALTVVPPWLERSGEGKKGDPYVYRQNPDFVVDFVPEDPLS